MEIVTVSTLESASTIIVYSAPEPSPFIGTLVYVRFPVPIPTPRLVIVAILIEPSTALSLIAALVVLVDQLEGTGI